MNDLIFLASLCTAAVLGLLFLYALYNLVKEGWSILSKRGK